MKKALASILLLVYFTVSSGFAVNMHYCMDRFDSVQLGAAKNQKCSKCGMKTADSNGCCRNEVKVVKLQQEPLAVKYVSADFSLASIILPLSDHLNLPFCNFLADKNFDSSPPPLLSEQDTHLTHCVFRI